MDGRKGSKNENRKKKKCSARSSRCRVFNENVSYSQSWHQIPSVLLQIIVVYDEKLEIQNGEEFSNLVSQCITVCSAVLTLLNACYGFDIIRDAKRIIIGCVAAVGLQCVTAYLEKCLVK